MDLLSLQNQVRNSAEDLQTYLKDLSLWNKEMKRKEAELEGHSSYSKEIPPVRSKKKKPKINQESSTKEKSERISALDYSSWEKFDVEKACDEMDASSSQSESEMEVPPQVQYRLREEALFEKEKGNQYVKNQKWDDAIKCYTRAIKCYPHDAIYYANRALCYLKIKDFKATEADCTSALQLDGTYVKAYQRRAAARVELNQVQEAIADLHKVLELEPKNTASRQELAKLEKTKSTQKVAKPVAKELKSKSSVDDAVPGPSGLSEIKKTASKRAKCSTNQGILDKKKIEVVSTGKPSSPTDVQPIQKPPHLRSKKPLRRIKIEELDSFASSVVAGSNQIKATRPQVQQILELQTAHNVTNNSSKHERVSGHHCPTGKAGEVASGEVQVTPARVPPAQVSSTPVLPAPVSPTSVPAASVSPTPIPPAPVSSVQFFVGWNKVKGNSKLAYLYLRQINGSDLPKLFQDSLESNILSSVLLTLVSEFVKEGSPIFSYLLGLSNVRRFSTLSFFLSKEEKEYVCKLLDHCLSNGECTESEAAMLKEKYEL